MTRRPTVSGVALLLLLASVAVLVAMALDDGGDHRSATWVFALTTFAFGCLLPFRSAPTSDDPLALGRDWGSVARTSGGAWGGQLLLAVALTPIALTVGGWGPEWLPGSLAVVGVLGLLALVLAPLAYAVVYVPILTLATQTGRALRGDDWPLIRVLGSLTLLAMAVLTTFAAYGNGTDPAGISGHGGRSGRTAHATAILLGLSDPDPGAHPWALWVARVAGAVALLSLVGVFAALGRAAVRPGTGLRSAR